MGLLFPKNINCIFCSMPISRKNYLSLCKKCYRALSFVEEICVKCGRFGRGMSMCTHCEKEKYHFDRVFSVLVYNDFIHHQLYSYKYGHKAFFGEYFGKLMKDFTIQNEIEYDFIAYVPISEKRTAQRGYNQTELIAEEMDKEKTVNLFVRTKNTEYLSGLSKAQRILAIEDAFEINSDELSDMVEKYYSKIMDSMSEKADCGEISDKNAEESDKKIKVLLVDDILTTGTTLNELSRLLKERANVHITALTLCSARGQL